MKIKLIAILASFLIAISGAVVAQDQDQDAPNPDNQYPSQDYPAPGQQGNPGPSQQDNNAGVARVSLIHGDVSTRRGDSGEWSAASLNAPVVAGDRVSTGDRSRAEVQLDYANLLRLSENAQANIVGLDRNQIQVQLGQGRANYTVFKNSQSNVEIDTPNVSIRPDRRDGSFAIYVTDGHTEVIARRGSADISTQQGSTRLESGQMITIEGTGDQSQYKTSEAPARDDFDRWASDRDHVIQSAQSWRHTNGYYTGSEDLDAYGHWRDVPDYGSVWVPTVGPGWAPYRAGQWVWEPGWGWTWVSNEPWGWAPYHYGRWMEVGGEWGWWPGPVYANPYYYPVWAPAYVSFFGFGGGGFGFGVGFGGWGSIGWLPIGPCDPFFPWWGGYRSRFNVVNITNINIYNNRGGWGALHRGTEFSNIRHAVNDPGFRRALSTVPANQFGHGRVNVQPVSREMFQNAHMVNGNLPVVPSRQSLQVSGRPAASSTISNRAQNQRFFSNTRSSAARPMSFENERAQLQNNIRQNSHFTPINGGPANGGNPRSLANEGNNPRIGAPERAGNTANGNGWRNFGGQNNRNAGDRPTTAERSSGNPGWNSAPRPGNSNGNVNDRGAATARGNNNNGGWQKFTPMPSRPSGGESMSRSSQNEPSRMPSRGESNPSRPPLNMRQPIATSRGGDYGRPSYGAPPVSRGGYSGPSGGYPAPSRGGYSAPSRGGYSGPGGGSYSAPSRGGYSAPSRGGYSAPSRGGSSAPSSHGGGGSPHSSGGGSHGGGSSSHSSNSGHHGR